MKRLITIPGLALALATYVIWSAATWFFEGRLHTLLRPDAVADRLVYALGVNLLLGTVATLLILGRVTLARRTHEPGLSGFGSRPRTLAATGAGLALGLAFHFAQGSASTHPVVFANAFAQVFVVSVAEVLVCWALVGRTLEAALRPSSGRLSTAIAAVIASVLFGLYHFAHSPPFDTWPMAGWLTVVGLFTSAYFFASRDVLGTVVFHNFAGTFGVTKALAEAGAASALETPQWPLIGTAIASLLALLAGYAWVTRRR